MVGIQHPAALDPVAMEVPTVSANHFSNYTRVKASPKDSGAVYKTAPLSFNIVYTLRSGASR